MNISLEKKKKIHWIIPHLLWVTLGMYAIFVFVTFMPNPASWDEGGRLLFVFLWAIASAVTAIMREVYIEKEGR